MVTCSRCGKPFPEEARWRGRLYKQCQPCRAYAATAMAARRAAGTSDAEYQRSWRIQRRRRVLEHYGGRCVCCGEQAWQFLALDHKNGGGNIHRREVQQRGSSMIAWVIANGYPDLFVVRCHNCNQAREFYGVCPHETAGDE